MSTCIALTAQNKRCKNKTAGEGEYCYLHSRKMESPNKNIEPYSPHHALRIDETVVNILLQMEPSELVSMCSVNMHYARICRTTLFRQKYLEIWGLPNPFEGEKFERIARAGEADYAVDIFRGPKYKILTSPNILLIDFPYTRTPDRLSFIVNTSGGKMRVYVTFDNNTISMFSDGSLNNDLKTPRAKNLFKTYNVEYLLDIGSEDDAGTALKRLANKAIRNL